MNMTTEEAQRIVDTTRFHWDERGLVYCTECMEMAERRMLRAIPHARDCRYRRALVVLGQWRGAA